MASRNSVGRVSDPAQRLTGRSEIVDNDAGE
jgi:hypothetical protein